LRVVFFGNHTVGVRALSVLEREAEVVGVVAHPPDPEDGERYESVFSYATKKQMPTIRSKGTDTGTRELVSNKQPDLIWITDYRYLLPPEIIKLPRLGAVNLHPSLLPKYRGRAPINWAILNGETRLGLTAHYADEGMDMGDIIEQQSFDLRENEDVGDALLKLFPLYESITSGVLLKLREGKIQRFPQDHSIATEFPVRRPADGLIDWANSSRSIFNLIRAVAAPYPGAFSYLFDKKVYIWKATLLHETFLNEMPGTIVGITGGHPIIACGQGGGLRLDRTSFLTGEAVNFKIGQKLSACIAT
jgi:methionyl-tRNA formyltransferase